MTPRAAPALALHDITRHFGRVRALDRARFTLRPGTIHALLGENGAGKTTLMRVAFGLVRPDAGSVERNGSPLILASPRDAIRAGIGMVHQHFSLVPHLSVAENLSLGQSGLFSPHGAAERARSIFQRLGLEIDPEALVAELSVGRQQQVEIAKALLRDAAVLILDEPTSVLAPREAEDLLHQLRTLAAAGTAIVLITHKLTDALRFADDVTVLRRGETVLENRTADVSVDMLLAAMLGSLPDAATAAPSPAAPGDVVLEARAASVIDERGVARLVDVNLTVRRGEILGVAAVEGSGQRELLRLLAGRLEPSGGVVVHPAAVGFIPDDRHRDAVILDFTLTENVALAGTGQRHGRLAWPEFEQRTNDILREFDISAAGPRALMSSLSGGNQQRVVVARELKQSADALVVENPTRGLDVNAARRVHDALRLAARGGRAVVAYSSDLDEIVSLADRIVVCFAGRVAEVEKDISAIGRAMVGAAGVKP